MWGPGKGVVLAREQGAYAPVAKYTALSASSTIAGGSVLDQMTNCMILTISTVATDYPLVLEYVQTFVGTGLYTYSENATAQIWMGKLCSGAVFDGLQQEHGVVRPYGFYFSAAGASPSSPDYRGVAIRGGRALSIYAEDLTRLTEFVFDASTWRGADTWQMDVYTMYDSKVHYDGRATSVSTSVPFAQYRVRSISRSNDWGPVDTAPLTAPTITLGTTSGSGGTFAAGTYYWVVAATNSYGETIASNEVTATIATNGTQVINWTTTTGATGYKVFRSATPGVYTGSTRVASLGIASTYTDTGTAPAAASPVTIATGGRPNAAYRGVAARMFDTFLVKPIWSDGAAWRDATGTAV